MADEVGIARRIENLKILAGVFEVGDVALDGMMMSLFEFVVVDDVVSWSPTTGFTAS